MTIIADRDYRDLMAVVASRTNAERSGAPAVEIAEWDRKVRAIQVRRDAVKLARKAADLPPEDRRELTEYFAVQLGIAA